MASRARPAAVAASLVMAFAVCPAAARAATTGTLFGGQTSQQDPFWVTVSKDHAKLVSAAIWVDTHCADGNVAQYTATVSFAAKLPTSGRRGNVAAPSNVSPTGAIKAKGVAAADYGTAVAAVSETLTGRVRGGRLTGTLALKLTLVDKTTHKPVTTCCKRVTFIAAMDPGRVFGGKTSDGLPVEVELDELHTRVNVLRIGWSASCTPSGRSLSVGDMLPRFPLSPSNFFGDSFTVGPFDAAGGGKVSAAYVVHGMVGRTKARGTFKVRVTDTDATGATTDTCATPAISWAAIS